MEGEGKTGDGERREKSEGLDMMGVRKEDSETKKRKGRPSESRGRERGG